MNKDDKKFDARKFLEDIENQRKAKEKKFNESKIGDLTGLELKELISSVIHEEFVTSKHPILNARRREKLEKAALIIGGLLIVLALIYKTFFYQGNYYVQVSKDKLFVTKTEGWTKHKNELKIIGKKWEMCSEEGQNCSPVFTPFEAIYNDNYKFIFVGNGAVFWVSNNRINVTSVKLIEGSWSFKNDYDDDWTDFDTYYMENYVQPEPIER
jgi:hypothetical protein